MILKLKFVLAVCSVWDRVSIAKTRLLKVIAPSYVVFLCAVRCGLLKATYSAVFNEGSYSEPCYGCRKTDASNLFFSSPSLSPLFLIFHLSLSPLYLPLFHVSIKKRQGEAQGVLMASWLCGCCELLFPWGTLFIQYTFTGANAGERCFSRKCWICLWSRLPSKIQFSINQEKMMGNKRMSMCIVPSASFTGIRWRIKVIASFFKMLKYAGE